LVQCILAFRCRTWLAGRHSRPMPVGLLANFGEDELDMPGWPATYVGG
jgi:hypothetical protein